MQGTLREAYDVKVRHSIPDKKRKNTLKIIKVALEKRRIRNEE